MRSWFYKNMAVRAAVRGILRYINNDHSPSDDDVVAAMEEAEEKNDEDDDEYTISEATTGEVTPSFNFSFSQALFRNSSLFPHAKDNVSITVGTNDTSSTCNPLGPPSIANSVSSVAGPGLRSILVDPSKAERKNKQKEASDTEALDEDKFVRFGK